MGEADVELAVADAVAVDAEDVERAGVLADLGADEGVTEGDDVGDALDVGEGGAGEGLCV